MSEDVIVALISLAGVLASLLLTSWLNRRNRRTEAAKCHAETTKLKAETEQTVTETALEMVRELKEQVATLEAKVDAQEERIQDLERENACLWEGVSKLQAQLLALGQTPAWTKEKSNGEPNGQGQRDERSPQEVRVKRRKLPGV